MKNRFTAVATFCAAIFTLWIFSTQINTAQYIKRLFGKREKVCFLLTALGDEESAIIHEQIGEIHRYILEDNNSIKNYEKLYLVISNESSVVFHTGEVAIVGAKTGDRSPFSHYFNVVRESDTRANCDYIFAFSSETRLVNSIGPEIIGDLVAFQLSNGTGLNYEFDDRVFGGKFIQVEEMLSWIESHKPVAPTNSISKQGNIVNEYLREHKKPTIVVSINQF